MLAIGLSILLSIVLSIVQISYQSKRSNATSYLTFQGLFYFLLCRSESPFPRLQ